jgi:hypothetical protein
MRHPATQGGDHVTQSCRTQRGHHTNAVGLRRQSTLARSVKKTLALQLCLEAQKLLKQRTLPGRLQAVHNELQIAPRAVNVQLAAGFHPLTVARTEAELVGRPAKHGAAHLPRFVFKRKVAMTAGCAR